MIVFDWIKKAIEDSEITVSVSGTTCNPRELLLVSIYRSPNLHPMNTFITTVIINHLAADYQVFQKGRKFKAILMQTYLGNCMPCQLVFWKERGVWKTHHPLTQYVISQFGNNIDNHLESLEMMNLKKSTAA